jgi:hypothetical protein
MGRGIGRIRAKKGQIVERDAAMGFLKMIAAQAGFSQISALFAGIIGGKACDNAPTPYLSACSLYACISFFSTQGQIAP